MKPESPLTQQTLRKTSSLARFRKLSAQKLTRFAVIVAKYFPAEQTLWKEIAENVQEIAENVQEIAENVHEPSFMLTSLFLLLFRLSITRELYSWLRFSLSSIIKRTPVEVHFNRARKVAAVSGRFRSLLFVSVAFQGSLAVTIIMV